MKYSIPRRLKILQSYSGFGEIKVIILRVHFEAVNSPRLLTTRESLPLARIL